MPALPLNEREHLQRKASSLPRPQQHPGVLKLRRVQAQQLAHRAAARLGPKVNGQLSPAVAHLHWLKALQRLCKMQLEGKALQQGGGGGCRRPSKPLPAVLIRSLMRGQLSA